jgi:hypothetical protein
MIHFSKRDGSYGKFLTITNNSTVDNITYYQFIDVEQSNYLTKKKPHVCYKRSNIEILIKDWEVKNTNGK